MSRPRNGKAVLAFQIAHWPHLRVRSLARERAGWEDFFTEEAGSETEGGVIYVRTRKARMRIR